MKRFTVTWHAPAEEQLTEIWLTSDDRASVQSAADRMEIELATRPLASGVLVVAPLRELVVPPLFALYAVREDDRVVQVAGVYRIPPERD